MSDIPPAKIRLEDPRFSTTTPSFRKGASQPHGAADLLEAWSAHASAGFNIASEYHGSLAVHRHPKMEKGPYQLERWRKKLTNLSIYTVPGLEDHFCGYFPALEHLVLDDEDFQPETAPVTFLVRKTFKYASKLRSLRLAFFRMRNGHRKRPIAESVVVSWAQLTRLELHWVMAEFDDVLQLLKSTERLRTLWFKPKLDAIKSMYAGQATGCPNPIPSSILTLSFLADFGVYLTNVLEPGSKQFCMRLRLPALAKVTFFVNTEVIDNPPIR